MRISVWAIAAQALLAVCPRHAHAADVLGAYGGVPATPAGRFGEDSAACIFPPPAQPMPLPDAIRQALCNNPKSAQAWAQIRLQAAAVGVSKALYLPTLTGTAQEVRQSNSTEVAAHSELSADYRSNVGSANVALNWILWDFGGREAALRNSLELLAAAEANQDAVLQSLFVTVAKDYYGVQAAQGHVDAALQVERIAEQSFRVAAGRVDVGIAPITDSLQAETALGQATFNRTKAEGDLKAAQGTLASDLHLRPDFPVATSAVEDGIMPDDEFMRAAADLMDEATRTHPLVLQALAQVRAAQAKEAQVIAQGLPSVSLVGRFARNNQPAGAALGSPQYPATGRAWSLGLQVDIPLFEGFGRGYEIQSARAQTEIQAAQLGDVEQQVALDVWTAFHALNTDALSVTNSARVLDLSAAAYQATAARYETGVGSVNDLLNAQSTLASAKSQRIDALTSWRMARLQLAGKLGQLRLGDAR